MIINSQSN